jgi:hypothetical protein
VLSKPVQYAVGQDIGEAIRPVFFQTEYEDFLYATHGGTLFVVNYEGKPYGITCGHVFQDFEHGQLFVTQEKQASKGSMPARVKTLCFPSSPRDGAEGTDIVDICVIEFADEVTPDFFMNSAYVIAPGIVVHAQFGHALEVAGVLKEKTSIIPPDINIGYCRLQFRDAGPSRFDPVLRHARAEFFRPEFASVTGISGAPVFDVTANSLCGMVIRGGMSGNRSEIYYADIFDITKLLQGVHAHAADIHYVKNYWL